MGYLWPLLIVVLTFIPTGHANVHKVVDQFTSKSLMNQISNQKGVTPANRQERYLDGVPPGVLETRNYGDTPFCFAVDGHSIGSKHFSENVFKRRRQGLAAYQAGVPGDDLFDASYLLPNAQTDLLQVDVTSIKVDGRLLEGWFHISVKLPENVPTPFYAVVIQVEDDISRRAVGEFTTELMDLCQEDQNNKDLTPTESQLLPCHATWRTQAIHSNAMVYFTNANASEIRTKKTSEIHTNWKIPPGFGCSFINKFFVRVDAMALPTPQTGHKSTKVYPDCKGLVSDVAFESDCDSQPLVYTSKRVTILMPGISKTKEFNVADAAPHSPGQVSCHENVESSVIQIQEVSADECQDTAWKLAETYREADDTDFPNFKLTAKGRVRLPIHDITVCRPHFADVHLGPCAKTSMHLLSESGFFKSGTYSFTEIQRHIQFHENEMRKYYNDPNKDYDIYAKHRSKLYLGRCKGWETGKQTRRTVDSDASYPISCELHKGEGYDEDNKYIDEELPTLYEYLKNLKEDICSCDPPGEDGALKIKKIPSIPTPKPNRPNGAAGGGKSLLGGETNDLEEKVEPKKKLEANIKSFHNFHGFFCILALQFFTPLSIFISRYLKETFHGKTLSTYDIWYTLHVICVAAVFWCLVYGHMVVSLLKPAGATTAVHVTFAVGMFIALLMALIGGGIRYGKSEKTLKNSIIFHAATGLAFYVLGVLCILVPLAGQLTLEDKEGGQKMNIGMVIALSLVILQIIMDVAFHTVMTLRVRSTDKELKLTGRPMFPLALIITDRDVPDKKFRIMMFWVYFGVTFAIVLAIIICMCTAEFELSKEAMERVRENIRKPENRY